ncbi:hypothetical protein I7I50_05643 [Histoplasma capsulatum G186AR]|uniref:Uncharacterized protein n=1 Tax=Ajellomyces capsulatus TaxID=5037 RepID=A0A8H7ZCM3_AJECA|nr:hypothetical protein I7I52_03903 [Histoplasma capsulatum]QSS76254.1 hypothetical protein I7I50_05643 [Histoplasma capsulatum G186AR]
MNRPYEISGTSKPRTCLASMRSMRPDIGRVSAWRRSLTEGQGAMPYLHAKGLVERKVSPSQPLKPHRPASCRYRQLHCALHFHCIFTKHRCTKTQLYRLLSVFIHWICPYLFSFIFFYF